MCCHLWTSTTKKQQYHDSWNYSIRTMFYAPDHLTESTSWSPESKCSKFDGHCNERGRCLPKTVPRGNHPCHLWAPRRGASTSSWRYGNRFWWLRQSAVSKFHLWEHSSQCNSNGNGASSMASTPSSYDWHCRQDSTCSRFFWFERVRYIRQLSSMHSGEDD